ncbi:MAG: phosphopyruvate hydratase [Alphaproteobacteria bacterium]|nr:phosphopyruvate hydratase [Alphaproteobacteria bacterium]
MKARITRVHARQIWDSRGHPTVEAEITLADGTVGRGIAPAGASRGRYEAIERRDGGERFNGKGVLKAVEGIAQEVAPALAGMDARDQAAIDARLEDLDGTPNFARIGGNASVAVSLAALQAAAGAERLPVWQYLAAGRPVRVPLPEIQLFGGGAHAGRRTDVQDFMIMAPNADTVAEAFEITAAVYHAGGRLMADKGLLAGVADEGGWWPNFESNEQALGMMMQAIERAGYRPGEEVFISLDIASSEFHTESGYRLALDGAELSSEELVARIAGWAKSYPIVSIEDPAAQDDQAGMVAATAAMSRGAQIVGDDFLVTDAARVERAAQTGACSAALIKVNQAGTVSRAAAALRAARKVGWAAIVSARSGETEDTMIAHLATGWDAGQIKVGSFARSERMAKWNELLRIEEQLGANARFAGWSAFPQSMTR